MDVQQISVFIENRAGRAAAIYNIIEEHGGNIRGFMISDTNDYGIVRIVVDKPDLAVAALKENGSAVKVKPILVAKLQDKPGELASLFNLFGEQGISITYAYSLISTYVALNVEDLKNAKDVASRIGVELVTQEDLENYHG